MHYTGWLRLVAIVGGIAVSLALYNLAGWSWLWASLTGVVVVIALHPLVGIVFGITLGIKERQEMSKAIEKAKHGGPLE
ncbi:MAG: hypothetical protein ACTHPD_13730 [Rhizomicrobium sp.]